MAAGSAPEAEKVLVPFSVSDYREYARLYVEAYSKDVAMKVCLSPRRVS